MALSKTTQDHEEIKAWAEKRGGKPADVESTETSGEAGIIRLEFPNAPNANDDNLKEINWEPFFEKFDKSGLAMVYQEVTSEGAESNFYKFVHPENVSGSAKKSGTKKAPAKKSAAKKAVAAKTAVPAKKTVPAKKASVKAAAKAPAKKAAAKTVAKNTTAKKAVAKKAPAKTVVAKKAPVKKAAAKKSPAKKSPAQKK
jgi:hypothetical protein